MIAALDERVEDQRVNVLRLRVRPDARIEAVGAVLDQHRNGFAGSMMPTASKQRRETNKNGA